MRVALDQSGFELQLGACLTGRACLGVRLAAHHSRPGCSSRGTPCGVRLHSNAVKLKKASVLRRVWPELTLAVLCLC